MGVVRHPGSIGVRRGPDRSIGGMRRQGPVDRFDEAVGEDEQTLRSLMEQGAAMEGSRVPGGFGVVSPSRVSPGSFTQDPGMRAADEFQDVTSAGSGKLRSVSLSVVVPSSMRLLLDRRRLRLVPMSCVMRLL